MPRIEGSLFVVVLSSAEVYLAMKIEATSMLCSDCVECLSAVSSRWVEVQCIVEIKMRHRY